MLNSNQYASASTLATRYDVTKATIWRWSREGKTPSPIKINGSTRLALLPFHYNHYSRASQSTRRLSSWPPFAMKGLLSQSVNLNPITNVLMQNHSRHSLQTAKVSHIINIYG